jgi:uncharacterized protein
VEFVIVGVLALLASGAALYSGIGLGTVLMPLFALFFPLEVAIAAAAVVHGAINFLKVVSPGPGADQDLVKHFGIPAGIAALLGAGLLIVLSEMPQLVIYSFGELPAVVTPLKLIIAILIIVFILFELLPRWQELRFTKRHLSLGGLLSGFFGGLSGHQCALRAVFLIKTGVTNEVYGRTNAQISLWVDGCRLVIYILAFAFFTSAVGGFTLSRWLLVLTGVSVAMGGILIGRRFLQPAQIQPLRYLTGLFLLIVALGLGLGLI